VYITCHLGNATMTTDIHRWQERFIDCSFLAQS